MIPEWGPEKWRDLKENPLISPVGTVIGDPQVLVPGEYDDCWHMYVWGDRAKGWERGGGCIYHYDSRDGINWRLIETITSFGKSCGLVYLYKEDIWYMLYTKYTSFYNIICVRSSEDLVDWSEETALIIPDLSWEIEGPKCQVRNPCLIKVDNIYRLYYSGGTIWLDDCGYEEPKYISFAESENILGPYKKYGEPIICPEQELSYRNFGAGAIKVFEWENQFLGFYNGIYKDREGRSRSAICIAVSSDGKDWIEAPFNPIIPPTEGWKKALVYQLDVVFDYQGETRIYYNARDGWKEGKERIGASVLVH